ncbi:MAG: acetoacetate--CoA ligase [Acidobacteriota bacterium]
MNDATPLWQPTPERAEATRLGRFLRDVGKDVADVTDMASLWQWSVDHPADFWRRMWELGDIHGDMGSVVFDPGDGSDPRSARFFPGARLNFAENLLRRDGEGEDGDKEAIVAWNENGRHRTLTWEALRQEVAAFAAGLRAAGVGQGDRVAGFLPNIPEAIIAMLATTSLGAVWSSSSPDFGVEGVLDRFGQIEPKVLITARGYVYSGKSYDSLSKVATIVEKLPSVETVVIAPYGESTCDVPNAVTWADFAQRDAELSFEPLPFDHPLYILYSSGTTGLPKCMVHGAGGTLIQHLKEHILHTDLSANDRILYVTTCGWMMWNWLASALAVGATVVLYDGAIVKPEPDILWRLAATERLTVFGTSAKYLALIEKADLHPGRDHDLSALQTILSTGSPLLPESYDYVYREIKGDLLLASISGGTDIVSCFALGNPIGPVHRGELQTRGLGMSVEILDPDTEAIVGEPGELCCTKPFPSMPVAFWNDPEGERYHRAYFDHFEGIWRHGDWATLTERGGLIIHGRSDATLNPGGVRIGTAEIYRQVETFDTILESLVIGQTWQDDVRIVLFVRMQPGHRLDDDLREKIKLRVRHHASPHHVPRVILQVDDLPRTRSGKITELAVKAVVEGRAVDNAHALANPEALEYFRDRVELGS